MNRLLLLMLAFAVVVLGACGGSDQRTPSAPSVPSPPALRTPLSGGLFGWPATEFTPSNKASVQTFVKAGDRAFEFSLQDPDGASYRLSDLLRSKPVLLVHGAFT